MTENETKWVIIWLEKVRDICDAVNNEVIERDTRSTLDAEQSAIWTAHDISQRVKKLMITAINVDSTNPASGGKD